MLEQRIRACRLKCGKTQEQACDELHWSLSKYSRIERGDQVPRIDDLHALAKCFSVTVEHLVGDAPAQKDPEMTIRNDLPRSVTDAVIERQNEIMLALLAELKRLRQ